MTAARTDHRVTLERTYDASVADLWDLWTTRGGFEAWWAPDGYRTEVDKLDLRVGGETVCRMIAVDPDQIEFLRKAGIAIETENRLTLIELVPMRRLAYSLLIDFVPGVDAYSSGIEVEFSGRAGAARMAVTLGPMHSEEWTRLAVLGMESQLRRAEVRFRK